MAAGLKEGLTPAGRLDWGGQRDEYDFHKTRRWDWRGTEHAQVDDNSQACLPHLDKDQGRLMSLNLEAVKSRPDRSSPPPHAAKFDG